MQTVLRDEASGHSQRWMRSLKAADTIYSMVPLFREASGHISPLDALQKYGSLHKGWRPSASRMSPGGQVCLESLFELSVMQAMDARSMNFISSPS
jgi:hypothetical protein